MATKVKVNRAPVMTLWAAVVAERLGFNRDEALTLGRGVAGLNAQSKGRRLGIFEPGEAKEKEARQKTPGEEFRIEILGRAVPAANTDDGIRAASKGKPINPASVERYLKQKFGEDLDEVRGAMQDLAQSYSPEDLDRRAYDLYERFRPEVPQGMKGWGAVGDLDLDLIRSLKEEGQG